MDFDTIEGLSEEEIIELYSNEVVDGINNGVRYAVCTCDDGGE